MSEFRSYCTGQAIPFGIALSIISSISHVQMIKYICGEYSLPVMTLTFLHFASISAGLRACRQFKLYNHVEIPLIKIAPITIMFCALVVLTNYSLNNNSVGTFQCLKMMNIPFFMLLSMIYKYKCSLLVKLSVVSETFYLLT
jgi:solute carrier family 35 protein E3